MVRGLPGVPAPANLPAARDAFRVLARTAVVGGDELCAWRSGVPQAMKRREVRAQRIGPESIRSESGESGNVFELPLCDGERRELLMHPPTSGLSFAIY
jgi:hypothetical protein